MTIVNENYPQNINVQELKAKLIAEHNENETKKSGFPTEIVSLPSKGLLYPESSILRSGKVEMKYMTASEEEILSTPSYIENSVALDKLFQALLVTPIKYNELLEADKDAIMVAARMLGYGPIYNTECTCPVCLHVNKDASFNLSELKDKQFTLDDVDMIDYNSFKFTLPVTKRVLTFKLLTHGDLQKVDLAVNAYKTKNPKGPNKELTTKLKHMILSVDGNSTPEAINNFVDNEFFAFDSKAFRDYVKLISPAVDFTVTYACKECLAESEMKLPIDVNFFWPRA